MFESFLIMRSFYLFAVVLSSKLPRTRKTDYRVVLVIELDRDLYEFSPSIAGSSALAF